MNAYIVVHRTSRDRHDLERGVHRDHWTDSQVCWCDPLVLYSDDPKFKEKVAHGLPQTLIAGNDAVIIFPEGESSNG
jgi:hypothetical protein